MLTMERGKRRRGEAGFTLVELLVVIVILGILSAVVVFAVRGAGDKGKGAAVAIEARTIRTALETYCAKKGHYPIAAPGKTPLQVMEDEKFLGSPSGYHTVETDPATLTPPFEGNCPGQPQHYKIGCQAAGTTPPNCGTSNSRNSNMLCGTSNPAVATPPDNNHDHSAQPTGSNSNLNNAFSAINGIYFADELNGWAVGNAYGGLGFARTTDGGINWTRYPYGPDETVVLNDVSFCGKSLGIAVGDGGFIFGTTDGGNPTRNPDPPLCKLLDCAPTYTPSSGWQRRESPVTNNLSSVDFVTESRAFAVGKAGTIVATDDGGFTWGSQNSGTTQDLLAVDFVDADTGYAVGNNGTILATTNGGRDWVVNTNFPVAGLPPNLKGVSFVDKNNGHVVGDKGTILNTIDAGASWQRPNFFNDPRDPQYGPPALGSTKFNSVSFADLNHGTAVGVVGPGSSDIWVTGDGGKNWKFNVNTYRINDVMFPRNLPPGRAGHFGFFSADSGNRYGIIIKTPPDPPPG